MRSNKLLSVAIVATAITPFAALAASPGYNYAEAGYVRVDFDGGPTVGGFGVDGSFALGERFHVIAGHSRLTRRSFTADSSAIALGYNHALTGETDLVARAGFVHGRVKLFGISASDDGWLAQAGVRSMVTDTVELNGFITHVNVGTVDGSETSVGIGGVYFLTLNLGISAGVDFSDDETSYALGLRFSF